MTGTRPNVTVHITGTVLQPIEVVPRLAAVQSHGRLLQQ